MRLFNVTLFLLFTGCAGAPPLPAQTAPETSASLETYAESRGWEALTPHEEVVGFYQELAVRSPDVRIREIGRSRQDRPLHLVTLSRPAVAEPWQAHASGKPILMIGAQVHGDEPAGKEGLMQFARDLALGELNDLLDEVVFVFVPQLNPDGAEAGEWGTRANSAGYNLNRDYLRLVNPEARAMVEGAIVPWRPHVIVDAHELPGPPRVYDFYTLSPRNLNGPTAVSRLAADGTIPAIERALAEHGFDHIVYHTAAGLHENPSDGFSVGGFGSRTLSNYGGAQGAVTMLYESLRERDARIGIERRARSQQVAMEALARYTAENAAEVIRAVEDGRREMTERGGRWDPADSIAIRIETVENREVDYRVAEMERAEGGEWQATGEILELPVPVRDSAVVTLGRVRPVGYSLAPHRSDLAEHLAAHGLQVERLTEPAEVEVEHFRVDSVHTAEGQYEGYVPREVWTTPEPGTETFPAGTFLVRAGQPTAALLFELLEPEGESSFASTGLMNAEAREGSRLPTHRLVEWPDEPTTLMSGSDWGH